jgi:hypothetical protein
MITLINVLNAEVCSDNSEATGDDKKLPKLVKEKMR